MFKVRNIYLIGLSGSGKTTIGKILAKKLKLTFVDTDKMIARKSGKSIIRIFEADGELAFRKLEKAAISMCAGQLGPPKVIALGGGAFESALNRKLVRNSGIAIWLTCPINKLRKRLERAAARPLLKSDNVTHLLKAQMKKRLSNYRKADLQISTSNMTPEQSVNELIKVLKKKYASD